MYDKDQTAQERAVNDMFGKNKKSKKPGKAVRAVRGLNYAVKLFLTDRTCTAIILAAGNSTRMGEGMNKQFEPVGGMPVLAGSIKAFNEVRGVKEIIIVARKDDMLKVRDMVKEYSFDKVRKIVSGGETRTASVMAGLRALKSDPGFVAIHDGARCLVTPKMINKVLTEARRTGAASAGAPVKDTIKEVGFNGVVESTPDRDKLWSAQTPQIFKTDLYRAAAYTAQKDGVDSTDDNFLLERLGGRVTMVDCGYSNIKITTPEDLAFARAIVEMRGKEENGQTV